MIEDFTVDHAVGREGFEVEVFADLQIAGLHKADHLVSAAQGADGVFLGQTRQVAEVFFCSGEFALAALFNQCQNVPPGQQDQDGGGQPDERTEASLAAQGQIRGSTARRSAKEHHTPCACDAALRLTPPCSAPSSLLAGG